MLGLARRTPSSQGMKRRTVTTKSAKGRENNNGLSMPQSEHDIPSHSSDLYKAQKTITLSLVFKVFRSIGVGRRRVTGASVAICCREPIMGRHSLVLGTAISLASASLLIFCTSSSVGIEPAGEDNGIRERTLAQQIEDGLQGWTPDRSNLVYLIEGIHNSDMVVTGSWATLPSFDWSRMEIVGTPDRLSVQFSTGGCLGSWAFERTGVFTEGYLRLDKPVEEYRPVTYDTLYPVCLDGRNYLISQAAIRFVLKHYSTNGVIDWKTRLPNVAFQRSTELGDVAGPLH